MWVVDDAVSISGFLEILKSYRYSVGSEDTFQRGVEQALQRHGIVFLREHQLGPEYGRIDFYVPDAKIGIELKVKGSPSQVLRQLHRYALSPDISALILLTARRRLAFSPMQINGRPFVSVPVWEGQL
jgi:hypothetical protein